MHEKIFPKKAIGAKHREGMLGAYFDCLLSWMRGRGYSTSTIRVNIQSVTLLGKYLEGKDIRCIGQLQSGRGQKVLAAYQDHWKAKGCWRRSSASRLCMRVLEEAGVLKTSDNNKRPLLPEIQQ